MQDYRTTKEAQKVVEKYSDILYSDRPRTERSLVKHPRMPLENRAKIFAPFSALRGYEGKVAEEGRRMSRVAKRVLSEEAVQTLSKRLAQVKKGMELRVVYFDVDEVDGETSLGFYREMRGRVEQIDSFRQTLHLCGKIIPFSEIREIVYETDEILVL